MTEHPRPEREVDEMEERSERLENEIDEAREDWERKKADASVPGAAGDPEETGADVEFDRAIPQTRTYSATPSAGSSTRPARSVTVPIRRAPGWCAASRAVAASARRGRHDGAEAAAHVEDLPHLGVGDRAELLDELEDGRNGQRVGDLEARRRGSGASGSAARRR